MQLQKITTRYSVHQDRLYIDGQFANGEIVRLWLTYRLMRELLPPLLKLITPQAQTEAKAAILAEWALTHARSRQQSEKPVSPPAAGAEKGSRQPAPPASCLVGAIELKPTPKSVTLAFKRWGNQPVADLEFKPEHLRQWLSIVYGLWNRAGWPDNEWPDWVKKMPTLKPDDVIVH
jgi:hypothetical protein